MIEKLIQIKNETQNNVSNINIELTRSKTKSFTRPSLVINQHPEYWHDFLRKRVVHEERLYKDALNKAKSKNKMKQFSKL